MRLSQGRREAVTIEGGDPVELARRFRDEGAPRLHLVDLDGAFCGTPTLGLVERVAAAGGPPPSGRGRLPDARGGRGGARRRRRPCHGRHGRALPRIPRRSGNAVRRAAARRDRRARRRGRRRGLDPRLGNDSRFARALTARRRACAAAGHEHRPGRLAGRARPRRCWPRRPPAGLPVIAAGGISSVDDLVAVRELGCEAAVAGSALLAGRFTLAEAFARLGPSARRTDREPFHTPLMPRRSARIQTESHPERRTAASYLPGGSLAQLFVSPSSSMLPLDDRSAAPPCGSRRYWSGGMSLPRIASMTLLQVDLLRPLPLREVQLRAPVLDITRVSHEIGATLVYQGQSRQVRVAGEAAVLRPATASPACSTSISCTVRGFVVLPTVRDELDRERRRSTPKTRRAGRTSASSESMTSRADEAACVASEAMECASATTSANDGFSWIVAEPMTRTSHALAAEGKVWLVDPVDWPKAIERAQRARRAGSRRAAPRPPRPRLRPRSRSVSASRTSGCRRRCPARPSR